MTRRSRRRKSMSLRRNRILRRKNNRSKLRILRLKRKVRKARFCLLWT
jgi:hypothetical protein